MILLLLSLFTGGVLADIWYVNKSGDDSWDGKSETYTSGTNGPLLNINTALGYTQSGDTIVVGRGYYNEYVVTPGYGVGSPKVYIRTDSVVVKSLEVYDEIYLLGDSLIVNDTLVLWTNMVVPDNNYFLYLPKSCDLQLQGGMVDGRLYRQISNGAGSLVFPVGVSGDYRPAEMSYNQNIPDERIHWMQVFMGPAPVSDALPAGIRNISQKHYWQYGRLGSGQPTDYIFTLYYSSVGNDDEVQAPAGIRVMQSSDTGTWRNLGGSGSAAPDGSIQASAVTDTTGYLTIGNIAGYLNPLGSYLPFAGFTVQGKCVGTPITFTDTSLNMPPASIVKWFWDFGDTTVTTDTSSLQSPQFVYDTAGIYEVKLWVENDSAMVDSAMMLVEIRPLPVPGILTAPSCFGQAAVFTDTSVYSAPDAPASRLWDFGDGTTSVQQIESHTYATRDTFDVKLVVTSSAGCTDSLTVKTWVSYKPEAGFDHTAVCFKQTTAFADTSKVTSPDTILSYSWDFGDGSTHIIKNPTYTYATSGSFTVQQIVTTNAGCMDTAEQQVTVNPLPEVFIEAQEACFGQPSRFKDTSRIELPDTIQTRLWHLGDGSTASSRNISYIYGVSGNFNLKLILTSGNGCIDSATAVAVVHKKPSPDFVTGNVCIGQNSRFVRIPSTDPPDNELKYTWFDNYSLKSSDTLYSSVLAGAGDHTITLVATTNKNCRDSMVQTATVFSKPALQFNLDPNVPRNDSIQCFSTNKFTFNYAFGAGQSQSVNAFWKWGDGTTSPFAMNSHSYSTQDTFTVKFIGITNQNCSDSASSKVIVRGLVTPQIAKLGFCTPDSIIFYDSGSVSTSNLIVRNWKFSSGNTAVGDSIAQWIVSTGPVDATYTVMNAEGCIDSVTRSFTFTSYPVISFLVSGSLPFCPGDSIQVRADGGDSIKWLFDNDTTRTRRFYTAGFYKVLAYSGIHCTSQDSFQVITFAPANIQASPDTTITRGDRATLRVTGGISYNWTPPATLNQNFGPQVVASPGDSQTYIVTGTTIDGCVGRDTVTVLVADREVIRIPNLITPNADGFNDFWVLSDLPELSLFDIIITDYAGKIVFEVSDYQNNWNATKDGEELPEGIYYYSLKHRQTGDITKGFIQVIR